MENEDSNEDFDKLDKMCQAIDVEKLHEISLKTGQKNFSYEDVVNLGCVSKENKSEPKVFDEKKKFSHKEVKNRLLAFKHNFEANADNSCSDDLINAVHDHKTGSLATFTLDELRRRLFRLKRCLEVLCDYYCSDSIINKYLE